MDGTGYPASDRMLLEQIISEPRFRALSTPPRWAWQQLTIVAASYSVVLLWLLPQRLAVLMLAYSFGRIQHPEGVEQRDDPFHATRMIRGGRLIRWITIGQSEHLIHHLFPGVPWYRYHDAWEVSRAVPKSMLASRHVLLQSRRPARTCVRTCSNLPMAQYCLHSRRVPTLTCIWAKGWFGSIRFAAIRPGLSTTGSRSSMRLKAEAARGAPMSCSKPILSWKSVPHATCFRSIRERRVRCSSLAE